MRLQLWLVLMAVVGSVFAGTLDGVEGQHAIAMHGSVKYPPGFKNFDYVNPDAPKGGSLLMHHIGTFDSFNSFIVKGNPSSDVELIYNALATQSADEAFTQYGELAEEIYMPEDRSWVAFKLRADARWHDGKPITVEDVIWTFNTLVKEGLPFFRFYYGNIAEVIKGGDDIVRFNFKPGENQELPLIIGQLVVLPKHYWSTRDFSKTTLEPPLGSGPYRIKTFEPGRSLILERVDDYWGKNIAVHKGYYNFDEIRFDYYRDGDIALEAFKAGEYDLRQESSAKNWATAYEISAVKEGLIVKRPFEHNRTAGMQGFVFNSRRAIFKDVRVRKALAYAFDFEWSNQNLFYNQYVRSRSYFDNSELAATGLPGPDELKFLEPLKAQLPAEVFTTAYEPPAGGGPRALRRNLRVAGQLLEEAGWSIKEGKRVHRDSGQQLLFEVMLVSPSWERIVLPYGRNLEKLGVDLTVRTVDTSQYRQRLDSYDFDMIVMTFPQSQSPGNEQRAMWGSDGALLEGGRNYIGIRDPAIDVLIEHVIEAKDRPALIAATRATDRALQWGHWVIPHWHVAMTEWCTGTNSVSLRSLQHGDSVSVPGG
ncbi:MAG: extracellular solute-binding protein [Pseudomonadales bacterium]|nr:extracellular solute-binding protein [Pseudomonadales bacterium]